MFKCDECGAIFTSPVVKKTTYEREFGILDDRYTPLRINLCPECGSNDITEYPYDLDTIEEMSDLVKEFYKKYIG